MRNWTLGIGAATALALMTISTPASALNCGPFVADPATACGTDGEQNDSVAGVNAVFPRDKSWEFIDKDDELVGDTVPGPDWTELDFYLTDDNGGQFIPGQLSSGRFYISDAVLAAFDELVFAMKGGNDAEFRWAGFLLDLDALTDADGYRYGTWSSLQALSHGSLYGYGDGGDDNNNVPEPGSLMLLGLGLGLAGFGALRRHKTA